VDNRARVNKRCVTLFFMIFDLRLKLRSCRQDLVLSLKVKTALTFLRSGAEHSGPECSCYECSEDKRSLCVLLPSYGVQGLLLSSGSKQFY
jgi:hypothetical protein